MLKSDIVVNGAGVAGLWATLKLSEAGYSVVVLERNPDLAGYASTRNEGWLHRGTYHGAAIPGRDIALRVARQTCDGFRQTLRFAPEAVEEETSLTFALLKDIDIAEVEWRWSEVGVLFQRVSASTFAGFVPEVRTSNASAFYRVNDVSIDSRVLYRKLLESAMKHGARVLANAQIQSFDGMRASVLTPAGVELCEANMFVYAAGFGIKEFFLTRFEIDLPLRLWKSHLIDLPRVARHGVFFLDAGEATLMHHKTWTIAGFNSDSAAVTEPSFDIVPNSIEVAREALKRMLYHVDFTQAKPRACIKVDRDPGADVDIFVAPDGTSYPRPQLGVTFGQPVPGHLWVLPGKMTEAPYVADAVLSVIRAQLTPARRGAGQRGNGLLRIAKRPIDTYHQTEAFCRTTCNSDEIFDKAKRANGTGEVS